MNSLLKQTHFSSYYLKRYSSCNMCSNFIGPRVSLLLKHIHDVGCSSSSEYYQIEFDCEEWKWPWRDGGETQTQFFSPQRPPKSVKNAMEFP